MIEKLDKHLASNINSCNMSQNIMVAHKTIEKINEIIDTIYDMQLEISSLDPDSEWYDGNHIAGTSKKVDPYAEQRKWIGKLCHFWNNIEYTDDEIGILEEIVPTHKYSPELDYFVPYKDNFDCWYEHCEPVKPSDTIIYKE